MNNSSTVQTYRPRNAQQQNGGYVNNQQQSADNEPPRAFTAPYTANVFGGEASFQPIPTLTVRPRTYFTLNASANLFPGLLSAGVSKTIRFDPLVRISPTNTGGVTLAFTPRLELELSGRVRAGLDNIFNSGVGLNGRVGAAQRFTFGGPEFSANLEPTGTFNANANFNPTLGSDQRLNLEAGVGLNAGAFGVGANQNVLHRVEQQVKVGGPGIQFQLTSTGQPTISSNFDRSVSISNSYTFSPRTNLTAQVRAGQLSGHARVGAGPSFTVAHKVTFSTDPAKKGPPKHEVSVRPGAVVDGSFGLRLSLFPNGSPVNISAEVGFNPIASVSNGARYTV
jgi:hypothetical protein